MSYCTSVWDENMDTGCDARCLSFSVDVEKNAHGLVFSARLKEKNNDAMFLSPWRAKCIIRLLQMNGAVPLRWYNDLVPASTASKLENIQAL